MAQDALIAKPIPTIGPPTILPPPPPDVCIPPYFEADEDGIAVKLNSGELAVPSEEAEADGAAADSFAIPTIRPVRRCENGPFRVNPVAIDDLTCTSRKHALQTLTAS